MQCPKAVSIGSPPFHTKRHKTYCNRCLKSNQIHLWGPPISMAATPWCTVARRGTSNRSGNRLIPIKCLQSKSQQTNTNAQTTLKSCQRFSNCVEACVAACSSPAVQMKLRLPTQPSLTSTGNHPPKIISGRRRCQHRQLLPRH